MGFGQTEPRLFLFPPFVLDQLIEAGADVCHEAHNMWTPLHCASAAGDAHACAILVEGGADVNAKVWSLDLT